MSESSSIFYLLGVETLWLAGLMPLVVVFLGEGYRPFKKGASLRSVVIFVVAVIGFINYFIDIAVRTSWSCYETMRMSRRYWFGRHSPPASSLPFRPHALRLHPIQYNCTSRKPQGCAS